MFLLYKFIKVLSTDFCDILIIMPVITESFEPDRIALMLLLSAAKIADKKSAIKIIINESIFAFLTEYHEEKS